MKQIVTLLYTYIFYSFILLSCSKTPKKTRTLRMQPSTIERRGKPAGGNQQASQNPEKEKSKIKTDKLPNGPDSKSRKTAESNGRTPARLGYNKSLIAIQEKALADIFENGSNHEKQGSRSAKTPDVPQKSIELGKTQKSTD